MGLSGILFFFISVKACPVETWFSLGRFEIDVMGFFWQQDVEQTLELVIATHPPPD